MTGHMHRRALMAKKTSIGLILIIGWRKKTSIR
jgi:hypothetical protein